MSMEIAHTGYAQATFSAAGPQAARPGTGKTEREGTPAPAQTDRVEISAQGREAAKAKEPDKTAESPEEEEEEAESKTTVAFNAEKRARQLAAARTRGEVQEVLALLEQDLSECKAGLENGWCDENEVAKVQAMIQQAQSKLAQVAGNDEEETPGLSAFDLAGLM